LRCGLYKSEWPYPYFGWHWGSWCRQSASSAEGLVCIQKGNLLLAYETFYLCREKQTYLKS
jgi:hypothetical protein